MRLLFESLWNTESAFQGWGGMDEGGGNVEDVSGEASTYGGAGEEAERWTLSQHIKELHHFRNLFSIIDNNCLR